LYSEAADQFIRYFNISLTIAVAIFAVFGVVALVIKKWRLKIFGGNVFFAFCVAALAAFALEASVFNFQHYLKYFADSEISTTGISNENPHLILTSEAGYSAEIVNIKTEDSSTRASSGIRFKDLDRKVTSIFAEVVFITGESVEIQVQCTNESGVQNRYTKKLYRYMPHRNYASIWPRGKVSELLVTFKEDATSSKAEINQIVLNGPIPFYFSGFRLLVVSLLIFVILAIRVQKLRAKISSLPNFWEKHRKFGERSFVYTSIGIVVMSFIVIIIMYVKCRSLWLDEAFLAESVISRSWSELLIPPLSNDQSAPVLYVIFVKLIGQIFGYTEFSLRVFSLLAWIGLLICEKTFLKRVLGCNNIHTTPPLLLPLRRCYRCIYGMPTNSNRT